MVGSLGRSDSDRFLEMEKQTLGGWTPLFGPSRPWRVGLIDFVLQLLPQLFSNSEGLANRTLHRSIVLLFFDTSQLSRVCKHYHGHPWLQNNLSPAFQELGQDAGERNEGGNVIPADRGIQIFKFALALLFGCKLQPP